MKKFSSKLRIAVLIDTWFPFQGGGQVHVRETSKRLKEKYQWEIVIFHGSSANILRRIIWNILVVPQVIMAYIQKPFDLIHAQAYSAGLPAKILSFVLGLPVVYTIHGCNSLDIFYSSKLRKIAGRGLVFRLKYFFERWLLTGIKYDAQISVARNFLKYPNLNKKIYIIPNGVETKEFKLATEDLRKNNRDKLKLLFVGRLEKIKGLDLLLQALARIKNRLPVFELRVIGDGSQKRKLELLTSELGLNERVRFLGRKIKKDLAKEYYQANIFLLPSLSEGQPLTLLEAWAAQLPVIVTRVSHNQYMVEENKDGFLVEPGSIESLEKILIKAFEQVNKWPLIGERGYKKTKKDFTWEKTIEKIAGVYSQVLKYN